MGKDILGPNTDPATCENCGKALGPNEGIIIELWGYPWDSGDLEGSVQIRFAHYTICQMATECARRVIDSGTNLHALREIAQDYNNLGLLALQATSLLQNWIALIKTAAETADLCARENGAGAIGGMRGTANIREEM